MPAEGERVFSNFFVCQVPEGVSRAAYPVGTTAVQLSIGNRSCTGRNTSVVCVWIYHTYGPASIRYLPGHHTGQTGKPQ